MLEPLERLRGDSRGITGLETAIILIAFVVVASVFAYTVLSAGIFSSEKGKEAVHSGLKQTGGLCRWWVVLPPRSQPQWRYLQKVCKQSGGVPSL